MPPTTSRVAASGDRDCTSKTRMMSPDVDFQLQPDAEPFLDTAADQLDHSQHIPGGAAGVDDDAIRVAVADLGAADAGMGQSCLLDQCSGIEAARVLKNPAGRLKRQRLTGLAN